MRKLQLFLAGQWSDGADTLEVCSPYDSTGVSRVARGGPAELAAAADAAEHASPLLARMTAQDRADILVNAAALVDQRRQELAQVICEEAGKPISFARVEVDRCCDTFAEAAAVARHPEVTTYDLGGYSSGQRRLAVARRVPIGPVLAITPFNFPLNLVAHKLAPAIAAGCPVLLKPASQTPSPALLLAAILEEAGLPPGGLSVIPSRADDVQTLVATNRFRLLTFTGSGEVGWRLKELAWRSRVTLELGGNAAVLVEPDVKDLDAVARRIATAAYGYAGQSCIAVQRVLVHEDIYIALRRALVTATSETAAGDPSDDAVVCGPVIDQANAQRIVEWIAAAEQDGGRVLAGGGREGTLVQPTLLEEVPPNQPLSCDEVFGPVAVLDPYEEFAQALLMVNDSRYGLQAGVFTNDHSKIQQAWEELTVGGIIQGDVPTWRSDPMPYGGVKGSGTGREGPRFTYREMTEERLLVLSR